MGSPPEHQCGQLPQKRYSSGLHPPGLAGGGVVPNRESDIPVYRPAEPSLLAQPAADPDPAPPDDPVVAVDAPQIQTTQNYYPQWRLWEANFAEVILTARSFETPL